MAIARGNKFLKFLDKVFGPCLLIVLTMFVRLRTLCSSPRSKPETDKASIAVVCFGAIGDVLILSSVAKRMLPDCRLILICSRQNKIAGEIVGGVYDSIHSVKLNSLRSVFNVLSSNKPSFVVDSTQWANISLLQIAVARLVGPKFYSIGFRRRGSSLYDEGVLHSSELHESQNFANLFAALIRSEKSYSLEELYPDLYCERQVSVSHNAVLLHMWPSGTRSYLKEWPSSYWAELIRYFLKRGVRVYVTGAPNQAGVNESFINEYALEGVENLAGRLSFGELGVFLREKIDLCVSVNTGNLHLAALMGCKTIGLHGPTDPIRWGPVGSNSVAILPDSGNMAYLNLGFEYPKSDDEAYSLDKLPVSKVIDNIERIMSA